MTKIAYFLLALVLTAFGLMAGNLLEPARAFNLAFFSLLCTALLIELTQPRTMDRSGLDYK